MSNDKTTPPTDASSPTTPASSAPPAELRRPPNRSSIKEEPPATATDDRREQVLAAKRQKRAEAAKQAQTERYGALKEYVYTGPNSAVTFGAFGLQVNLHPNTVVKLPPESRLTKNLVERGYATPKDEVDRLKARERARKGVN